MLLMVRSEFRDFCSVELLTTWTDLIPARLLNSPELTGLATVKRRCAMSHSAYKYTSLCLFKKRENAKDGANYKPTLYEKQEESERERQTEREREREGEKWKKQEPYIARVWKREKESLCECIWMCLRKYFLHERRKDFVCVLCMCKSVC